MERRHPDAGARRGAGDLRSYGRARQGIVCPVVCRSVSGLRGGDGLGRLRSPRRRHRTGRRGARGRVRRMSRTWRIALFVVGATVFGYLVAQIGVGELASDAARTGWVFIPIVGLYALVYACSARAWQLIMASDPRRPSFWRALVVLITSSSLNFLTPVVNAGGEPYRAAAIAPWLGKRRAAGSVILHRLLHSFAYVLVWLSAVLLALVLLPP